MKLCCDNATAICDKGQYGEIKIWEKIKLGLHFLWCKKCRRYSKQNSILSKCYRNHQEFEKKKQCCLTDLEKECMDERIKENTIF